MTCTLNICVNCNANMITRRIFIAGLLKLLLQRNLLSLKQNQNWPLL